MFEECEKEKCLKKEKKRHLECRLLGMYHTSSSLPLMRYVTLRIIVDLELGNLILEEAN